MTRRAARVDANQPEIVDAVRRVGGYWMPTWRHGSGTCDGFVWHHGIWFPVELKIKGGRFTDDEIRVHDECPATIYVIRSVDEMMQLLGVTIP